MMIQNVYTPGCHLLCHDDVIGSRRVSWILYLLDPDIPWKPEWGGALRLYPTEDVKTPDGDVVKVPKPEFSLSIPPAWNQLSFFTVQPGESFHDVEEVYRRGLEEMEPDGGRVRMAISGWFHIPQKGEEGYEEGLEERLAEKSSLAQLQGGKADIFDEPRAHWIDNPDWEVQAASEEDVELTENDMDFLIKFMNPYYLTPDTVEEMTGMFGDESSLQLANFLSKKFSARLREYLESIDREENQAMPVNPHHKESKVGVARPPHKHRYLYRQAVQPIPTTGYPENDGMTPYDDLVDILFPHPAFTKWISLVTGITLTKSNIFARRFRRGLDYTLATAYEEEDPQLEICLGITPSRGWGGDEEEEPANGEAERENGNDDAQQNGGSNGKKSKKSKKAAKKPVPKPAPLPKEEEEVGGYEMYMAGDDDDHPNIPSEPSTSTGAGQRRKADPAIYKSAGDDEDDGILFSQPAAWNNLAIVLRDNGVLRFTKYVSKSAKGDRWDVCAEYGVEFGEDDEDDE